MLKKAPVIFFLVISSTLLLSDMASADMGQYLILSARYGNQWRNIDVTNQLKNLAARDARFRLDYKVFGDPAPGQAKTLRIYARGPDRRERMFEYADGSIIDGSIFIGWGSGQWGRPGDWSGNWGGGAPPPPPGPPGRGQYQILSAQYGNQWRHIDVTNRLQQIAAANARYRVDYKTFGDPAPGQAKSLRIYVRGPDRRERMFVYADGSIVDGSMFVGWNSGRWGNPNDRWSGTWDVPRAN
jgi:hypothetical protein